MPPAPKRIRTMPDAKRIERPLDHAQIFRAEQRCSQSHRCHFESPMYFGSQSVSSGM